MRSTDHSSGGVLNPAILGRKVGFKTPPLAAHGNSNKNDKPHHLYEIRDSVDNDVFKYGISYEPIGEDGYSSRMKLQVDFLDLGVKWLSFLRPNTPARPARTQRGQAHRTPKYP